MRIWSIHPQHLDKPGLGAAWREALLAQAVLLGLTKGYRNHPQLDRLKACADPIKAVGAYLTGLADEAERRGYRYDRTKIVRPGAIDPLPVTTGQIEYEQRHINAKIAGRSPGWPKVDTFPALHPMFEITEGSIEPWEVAHWRELTISKSKLANLMKAGK